MTFESIAPNERRYLLYAIDVDLDLDAQAIGVYKGRRANFNAALAAVNQVLELAEALA